MTNERLAEIIIESKTLKDASRHPEMDMTYRILRNRVKKLGLDTSHFKQTGRTGEPVNKIPLELILVEDSSYECTSRIKVRLISEGYKLPICESCGIGEVWNGKPLTLQLHHVNGKNRDHRIENVQLLCPNCHTQTETYVSRNSGK